MLAQSHKSLVSKSLVSKLENERTQSSITNFNSPFAGFIIGIAWLDISQNDAKSR